MPSVREVAQNLEVKKDGLSQLQDGCWVLKLKVNPDDMSVPLMQAPMGTRYIAALVEIGADEMPVGRKPAAAKGKRDFHDLPLSQQAALACQREAFQRFLHEARRVAFDVSEASAAVAVRAWCEVKSRSEIVSNTRAAAIWSELYADFETWLHEKDF